MRNPKKKKSRLQNGSQCLFEKTALWHLKRRTGKSDLMINVSRSPSGREGIAPFIQLMKRKQLEMFQSFVDRDVSN